MLRLHRVAVAAAAALIIQGEASATTTYRFRVSCESNLKVVEWRVGDLDPGQEYLRVATGLNNANCSISDYNRDADRGLPVEVLEGAEAALSATIGAVAKMFGSPPPF